LEARIEENHPKIVKESASTVSEILPTKRQRTAAVQNLTELSTSLVTVERLEVRQSSGAFGHSHFQMDTVKRAA
jgi:hypothetical protein